MTVRTDSTPNLTQTSVTRPTKGFWVGLLVLFGVILPAVTLAIELATHMCAGVFFDPIPTLWHVLAVAFVPAANAFALVALSRAPDPRRNWVWLGNGLAMGLTLFFTILYLPLTPLAAVAILMFGWGFLPLSPLLAFITTWRIRSRLRRHLPADTVSPRRWWLCFGGALALFVLLAVPENLTRTFAQMAVSENSQTSARGLQWLRWVGDRQTLLRDCYGAGQRETIHPLRLLGLCEPVTSDKARQLYYRVTGEPFTSARPPQARYQGRGWDFLGDFEWDPAVGGDSVAGLVKGLSLKESRFDALCSPDDAWEYIEWILEFQNESQQQREARLQIGLPAGAVVSRLTLWVDGEEREAAFAGRAQTKEAYRQVAVVQRRDPVLVTTSGPDRVLVQCFPVPSHGTMKVRLGVTTPLLLRGADEVILQWPCILERNFRVPNDFQHTIWLQSPQAPAVEPTLFKHERPQPDTHVVRGLLADSALANGTAVVRFKRNPERHVTATDTTGTDGAKIVQTIEEGKPLKPSRIVVVIDGSRPMKAYIKEIADALSDLGNVTETSLMIARDDGTPAFDASDFAAALDALRHESFRGGHDNALMLMRAWERAAEKPGSVVLWIHASQPVLISSMEPLRQLLEHHATDESRPLILEVPVQAGADRIVEKLDGLDSLKTIPRLGSVGDSIRDWIAQWRNTTPLFVAKRERREASQVHSGSPAASKHVARLRAREEIERLIRARKTAEAIALGTAYQLVTAVTGAVVLETARQYEQNNLHPADSSSVPTATPEPSTVFLVAFGIAATLFVENARRRRKLKLTQTAAS